MYALPQPEAQLSTCLFTVKDEDGITEIGNVHASRKVLPRVYIARIAVMKVYVRIPKLTTCGLQVQQFLLPFTP